MASLKVIAKSPITSSKNFTSFAANESIPFRVVTQKYGDQMVNWQQQSTASDINGNMYIELDLTKPIKNKV